MTTRGDRRAEVDRRADGRTDNATHPGDDGAAEVLQVGDDLAVLLHVSVLDELREVLLSNAWGR